MIYPKCFTGVTSIFITHDGFLQPCCMIDSFIRDKKNIESQSDVLTRNPFYDFSLHDTEFEDIVTGHKWNNFIDNLLDTDISVCHLKCGTKDPPYNTGIHQHNNVTVWNEKDKRPNRVYNLQIETTNRCTLKCLYCGRNRKPKNLNKSDLPIEIIDDALSYKHINKLQDCGNYGDPIFYKHYHEMLFILGGTSIKEYGASIAATGRTQSWWNETQQLWKWLSDRGMDVKIHWGIDGLEHTSKMHRVEQDWNEIIEQMRIASENGVNCLWRYIPMSFNEHQIDEARQLAEEWGVDFYLHHSRRFGKNDPNKPRGKYELKDG